MVHKEIKTSQLVLMSHDQLASEELSKWREEELKKVRLIHCLMCKCTVYTVYIVMEPPYRVHSSTIKGTSLMRTVPTVPAT